MMVAFAAPFSCSLHAVDRRLMREHNMRKPILELYLEERNGLLLRHRIFEPEFARRAWLRPNPADSTVRCSPAGGPLQSNSSSRWNDTLHLTHVAFYCRELVSFRKRSHAS